MGNFFYSMGVISIMLNLLVLLNCKKIFDITEWLLKYKKVTGKNPENNDFRCQNDKKLLLLWSFSVVYTVVWMIFGLLSKDWIIFLIVFSMNIILNHTKKLFSKLIKIKFVLVFIKSLTGLIIISFIIINYFHLKIDIADYFYKLLF